MFVFVLTFKYRHIYNCIGTPSTERADTKPRTGPSDNWNISPRITEKDSATTGAEMKNGAETENGAEMKSHLVQDKKNLAEMKFSLVIGADMGVIFFFSATIKLWLC